MAERKAVTKAIATRYQWADKPYQAGIPAQIPDQITFARSRPGQLQRRLPR